MSALQLGHPYILRQWQISFMLLFIKWWWLLCFIESLTWKIPSCSKYPSLWLLSESCLITLMQPCASGIFDAVNTIQRIVKIFSGILLNDYQWNYIIDSAEDFHWNGFRASSAKLLVCTVKQSAVWAGPFSSRWPVPNVVRSISHQQRRASLWKCMASSGCCSERSPFIESASWCSLDMALSHAFAVRVSSRLSPIGRPSHRPRPKIE